MIAKLVHAARGPPSTCEGDALDAFVIGGVEHNIPSSPPSCAIRAGAGRVDRLHRRGIQGAA
jgi:hypothetical protein